MGCAHSAPALCLNTPTGHSATHMTSDATDVPSQGGVADVAPTMLTYMGIDIPVEMTGKSFLVA